MAVYNDEKLKAMEDEMNRFEEEIGLPIIPPPPPPQMGVPTVIGANTYNTVQRQLEEQQHVPGMPVPITGFPVVAGIPPPPPPPPMLVPHQVRMRPAIRHPMRPMGLAPTQGPGGQIVGPAPGFLSSGGGQSGPSYMGPLGPGPSMVPVQAMPPVQPVTPVVSATPMMYPAQVSEPQLPLDMLDQGIVRAAEVNSMAPINMPLHNAPSVPILDTNLERNRNKPRPPVPQIPVVVPQTPAIPSVEETATAKKKKNKKTVRQAGGQTWEDPSLLEWEEDDFRLFCGDLGNDVTDEILTRTFSKYPSFLKAKVVRDKRTNKTKGFGFVSFKDPQDFIRAMKEMNGRYVGSRPIKLRKSSWKNRSLETVRKKEKDKAALIGLLTGK